MNKEVEDLIHTLEIELHLCIDGESEKERARRLIESCDSMKNGLTALLARNLLRIVRDDEN